MLGAASRQQVDYSAFLTVSCALAPRRPNIRQRKTPQATSIYACDSPGDLFLACQSPGQSGTGVLDSAIIDVTRWEELVQGSEARNSRRPFNAGKKGSGPNLLEGLKGMIGVGPPGL